MTLTRRARVLLALAVTGAVSAGLAVPALASLPDGSAVTLAPRALLLRAGLLADPAAAASPTTDPSTSPSGVPALAPSASPSPSTDPAAAARLGQRLAADLGGSSAATVAAAVDVDGLGTVLRQEAGHALPPASTRKIFTAAAALLGLPGDLRFTTTAATTGRPARGVVHGSLWLVAGGDPYLTSTELRVLAHAVRAAGVTRVAGDLLLDDSWYDGSRQPAGWKQGFMPTEAGPLSALALDGNQWRHDAAFLSDPALPAAGRFRDALAAEGVTVHGALRRGRVPSSATAVATFRSGPLTAIVRRLVKASDNFAAELLLKELGRRRRADGSSGGGVAAVRDVLGAVQAPPGPASDGSGLSANDRQTAQGELAVLEAVDASSVSSAFRAALPVACQDGTLVHRLCSTAAQGRLWAKTGTLDFVTALAGYTQTASGRTAWFSFILTGVHDQAAARAAIDRAAADLAGATE